MKFSIRLLFVLTLLVALAVQAVFQKTEINRLERELETQRFAQQRFVKLAPSPNRTYVLRLTKLYRQVLADFENPTQTYSEAHERFKRLVPVGSQK